MSLFKRIFDKTSDKEEPLFSPKEIKTDVLSKSLVGSLLVSKPFGQDPNFDRTVVLITAMPSSDHVLGLVINRPTNHKVMDIVPERWSDHQTAVNWGGPVADKQLFCIYKLQEDETLTNGSSSITQSMGFVTDFEEFSQTQKFKELKSDGIKFYTGIVQWKTEQLKQEILSNGWNLYESDCVDILQDNHSGLWDKFNPGIPVDLDRNILPIVRANYGHEIYAMDKNNPLESSNSLPESLDIPHGQLPISKELTEDLLVHYVEDSETFQRYLTNDFFTEFPQMTVELLERYAIRNLVRSISPKIQMHGSLESGVMVTVGGNYESSIIFVEGFMDYINNQMGGNVLVAVPTRDTLFLYREDDTSGIEKLKSLIKKYFDDTDSDGAPVLSKGIYLKKPGSNALKLVDTAF